VAREARATTSRARICGRSQSAFARRKSSLVEVLVRRLAPGSLLPEWQGHTCALVALRRTCSHTNQLTPPIKPANQRGVSCQWKFLLLTRAHARQRVCFDCHAPSTQAQLSGRGHDFTTEAVLPSDSVNSILRQQNFPSAVLSARPVGLGLHQGESGCLHSAQPSARSRSSELAGSN